MKASADALATWLALRGVPEAERAAVVVGVRAAAATGVVPIETRLAVAPDGRPVEGTRAAAWWTRLVDPRRAVLGRWIGGAEPPEGTPGAPRTPERAWEGDAHLLDALQPLGWTKGEAFAIAEWVDAEADPFGDAPNLTLAEVFSNPYALLRAPRVGFRTADAWARTVLGVAPGDRRRVRACGLWLLEEAAGGGLRVERGRGGHTWVPRGLWAKTLLTETGATLEVAKAAFADPDPRWLGTVADARGEAVPAVALPSLARAERELETLLCSDEVAPGAPAAVRGGTVTLTAEQAVAVATAATARVSAIVGAAGTGKTSAVIGVVEALEARGEPYSLLAPTGKAARRLADLTGRDASTVHRLLGVLAGRRARGEGDGRLGRRLVVVDEASMLDVAVLARLVRAASPDTRFAFVGDPGQLAPVGPGAPFADLLAAGAVPVARLTEILRSAGAIPRAAAEVLAGRFPTEARAEGASSWSARAADAGTLAAEVVAAWRRWREADPEGTAAGRYVAIAPMAKYAGGVDEGNAAVAAALTGGAPGAFRDGDRVLWTGRNNYVLPGARRTVDVLNGSTGVVERGGEPRDVVVAWDHAPERPEPVRGLKGRLVLGYVLTAHKAQGSEYEEVLVLLPPSGSYMVDRAWIYTATTRARRRMEAVGDLGVATRGARRAERRRTALAARLAGGVAEGWAPPQEEPS